MLKIKNWQEFQHYKDRSPPWIKLHHSLLDNYEFHRLPVASKALAPMLWLLASENTEGVISEDLTLIAFRLRMRIEDVETALKPLINAGFVVSDSAVQAPCLQYATQETETETETKGEKNAKPDRTAALRFADFWAAYPNCQRKGSKTKCSQVWQARNLDRDADAILAHVREMANSNDWQKQSGQFIPAPLTYLNQSRWDGFDPAKPDHRNDPFAGAI